MLKQKFTAFRQSPPIDTSGLKTNGAQSSRPFLSGGGVGNPSPAGFSFLNRHVNNQF